LAGLRAALIADQQAAVVEPDLRLLNWELEDPYEIAADKAQLQEWTRANPHRSSLLTKLLAGEPVVVERSALRTGCRPTARRGCARAAGTCGSTPTTSSSPRTARPSSVRTAPGDDYLGRGHTVATICPQYGELPTSR